MKYCFVLFLFFTEYLHSKDISNIDQNENQEQQQIIITTYPKNPIFIQMNTFWEENSLFLNPQSFKQLISSFPKLPLYNLPPEIVVKRILADIFSKERVLDELIRLSNTILSTYSLKTPAIGTISIKRDYFKQLSPSDADIIYHTIKTFIGIMSTPDPYRSHGSEWKLQTFIRSFLHLWLKLNGTEEDVQLNHKLRTEIGFAVGLFPDLQPKEVLHTHYPNLTAYLEMNTREGLNVSKKPIYSVFILSLMDALTTKMHQTLLEFTSQPSTNELSFNNDNLEIFYEKDLFEDDVPPILNSPIDQEIITFRSPSPIPEEKDNSLSRTPSHRVILPNKLEKAKDDSFRRNKRRNSVEISQLKKTRALQQIQCFDNSDSDDDDELDIVSFAFSFSKTDSKTELACK